VTAAESGWQRRSAGLCLALSVALTLSACGSEPVSVEPPPPLESLSLTPEQRERFISASFDQVIGALEVAEANSPDTIEDVRHAFDRSVVAWAGVVQGSRLMGHVDGRREIALQVSPPSNAGAFFPTTVQVVFDVPDGHPITEVGKGAVVSFVGSLEFDGSTREPWVLRARLADELLLEKVAQ